MLNSNMHLNSNQERKKISLLLQSQGMITAIVQECERQELLLGLSEQQKLTATF